MCKRSLSLFVEAAFRQYRAPLLSGQRSLDPVKLRTKTSASESSTSTNQPPPAFESPYATSNVVYDPERKIKVIPVHFERDYIYFIIPFLMVKSSYPIYYSLILPDQLV